MRVWRKFYSSILESERFMDVPTEAKLLFCLLVTAQDDTGYYPWERMKVRHLVATCGWTEVQAKQHADALVAGEMATWEEGGIVLRNGQELNGPQRGDRQPFIYQRLDTGMPVSVSVSQCHAKETEKITEKSKKQNKDTRVTVVDEDFVEKMVEKYKADFSVDEVREAIKDSQGHKAWEKWVDKQRYVDGWLRRNAERSNNGTVRQGIPGSDSSTQSRPTRSTAFANFRQPPDGS